MRDPYEGPRENWGVNPTTDEGYECQRCGCDHAPRIGPCWACLRREKEVIVELEEPLRHNRRCLNCGRTWRDNNDTVADGRCLQCGADQNRWERAPDGIDFRSQHTESGKPKKGKTLMEVFGSESGRIRSSEPNVRDATPEEAEEFRLKEGESKTVRFPSLRRNKMEEFRQAYCTTDYIPPVAMRAFLGYLMLQGFQVDTLEWDPKHEEFKQSWLQGKYELFRDGWDAHEAYKDAK